MWVQIDVLIDCLIFFTVLNQSMLFHRVWWERLILSCSISHCDLQDWGKTVNVAVASPCAGLSAFLLCVLYFTFYHQIFPWILVYFFHLKFSSSYFSLEQSFKFLFACLKLPPHVTFEPRMTWVGSLAYKLQRTPLMVKAEQRGSGGGGRCGWIWCRSLEQWAHFIERGLRLG